MGPDERVQDRVLSKGASKISKEDVLYLKTFEYIVLWLNVRYRPKSVLPLTAKATEYTESSRGAFRLRKQE